eukprot:6832412-Alexandrium_andersonii.AAC.1
MLRLWVPSSRGGGGPASVSSWMPLPCPLGSTPRRYAHVKLRTASPPATRLAVESGGRVLPGR